MQKMLARVGTWCRYQVIKQRLTPGSLRTTCHLHTSPVLQEKNTHIYSHMQEPWKTKEQLVEELQRNVLYEDRDILALNKPNGLPMHALKYTEDLPLDIAPPTSAGLSVTSVLPDLAENLGTPQLNPIYSQSRLFSGVIVLTKNAEASTRLKKYFKYTRQQKVLYQQYWALTNGVPKDQTNECELGLRRDIVNGWRMSTVEPKVTKGALQLGKMIRLKMKHDVVDRNPKYDCALVSLQPTGTKWDFIELYLTHQLCTALGDHIYSSRVRTIMGKPVLMHPQSSPPAPQVLPDYLLKALKIRKKDTEAVPTHIHCYQLAIPVMKHRSATMHSIKAPLPKFFKDTLQCLELQVPNVKHQNNKPEPLSSGQNHETGRI